MWISTSKLYQIIIDILQSVPHSNSLSSHISRPSHNCQLQFRVCEHCHFPYISHRVQRVPPPHTPQRDVSHQTFPEHINRAWHDEFAVAVGVRGDGREREHYTWIKLIYCLENAQSIDRERELFFPIKLCLDWISIEWAAENSMMNFNWSLKLVSDCYDVAFSLWIYSGSRDESHQFGYFISIWIYIFWMFFYFHFSCTKRDHMYKFKTC